MSMSKELIDWNPCATHKCSNNANCVVKPESGEPECICLAPFTGADCNVTDQDTFMCRELGLCRPYGPYLFGIGSTVLICGVLFIGYFMLRLMTHCCPPAYESQQTDDTQVEPTNVQDIVKPMRRIYVPASQITNGQSHAMHPLSPCLSRPTHNIPMSPRIFHPRQITEAEQYCHSPTGIDPVKRGGHRLICGPCFAFGRGHHWRNDPPNQVIDPTRNIMNPHYHTGTWYANEHSPISMEEAQKPVASSPGSSQYLSPPLPSCQQRGSHAGTSNSYSGSQPSISRGRGTYASMSSPLSPMESYKPELKTALSCREASVTRVDEDVGWMAGRSSFVYPQIMCPEQCSCCFCQYRLGLPAAPNTSGPLTNSIDQTGPNSAVQIHVTECCNSYENLYVY